MGKWTWVVLAIAMAGLAGYACGSDDDGGGTGGKGGNPGGGVCATDPNGSACHACGVAILGCLGQGLCQDEFSTMGTCMLQKCSNADEACVACQGEVTEYNGCMAAKCEGAKGCY